MRFILLFLFCLGAALPAQSEPAKFHYVGRLQNVPVLDIWLDTALPVGGNGPYRLHALIATGGTLDSLYPYRADVSAWGAMRKGQLRPASFSVRARLGQNPWQQARYDLNGRFDPLSALFAMSTAQNRACQGEIPVFDGQSTYSLALSGALQHVAFIMPNHIGPFIVGSYDVCEAGITHLENPDPRLAALGLLPVQITVSHNQATRPSHLPLIVSIPTALGNLDVRIEEQ
ncbi:MAG TPA: hypothetical protein VHL08_02920 [Dongiaceae bacterium]|jgi:hypothetical protein|nr:hypothetical protein [Dongiaceae bacterium]